MNLVFDDFPLETGFELRKDSGVTDASSVAAYTVITKGGPLNTPADILADNTFTYTAGACTRPLICST
jgi:hypothetical protein